MLRSVAADIVGQITSAEISGPLAMKAGQQRFQMAGCGPYIAAPLRHHDLHATMNAPLAGRQARPPAAAQVAHMDLV